MQAIQPTMEWLQQFVGGQVVIKLHERTVVGEISGVKEGVRHFELDFTWRVEKTPNRWIKLATLSQRVGKGLYHVIERDDGTNLSCTILKTELTFYRQDNPDRPITEKRVIQP